MSNKMKKFLEKTSSRKISENIASKDKLIDEKVKYPQNLLNESVTVNSDDKEMIYHYIEQPCNMIYVLKTYADEYLDEDRTIWFSRTMGTGNRCVVIFNSELEEISDFIVKMCDQMGWPFTSGVQEDTTKAIFEIFVRN
jgi:hypothetical protein